MYSFKRNAVQPIMSMAKARWNWSGNGTTQGQISYNSVAPQVETTVSAIDEAQMLVTTGALTLSTNQRLAFGVPMAVDHKQRKYHYEVSGVAVGRKTTGTHGHSLLPFVSYHRSPLTADETQAVNNTTLYRKIPILTALAMNQNIAATVNHSVMLDFDEADWQVGNVVFGWMLETQPTWEGVLDLEISVKKYVANIPTYDPHK